MSQCPVGMMFQPEWVLECLPAAAHAGKDDDDDDDARISSPQTLTECPHGQG